MLAIANMDRMSGVVSLLVVFLVVVLIHPLSTRAFERDPGVHHIGSSSMGQLAQEFVGHTAHYLIMPLPEEVNDTPHQGAMDVEWQNTGPWVNNSSVLRTVQIQPALDHGTSTLHFVADLLDDSVTNVYNGIITEKLLLGSFTSSPVADMKINGSDGPLRLSPGQVINVSLAFDPGYRLGSQSEWWVGVFTSENTYSFPLGQYPMFPLPNTLFFSLPIQMEGYYGFFFAVDDRPDGKLNPLYTDYVVVYCKGSSGQ